VRRTGILDVIRVAQLRLLFADLHQQLDGCFWGVTNRNAVVGRPHRAELQLGSGGSCRGDNFSDNAVFDLIPLALLLDDPLCRK